KLAAALWGRHVEAEETDALLEPFGEWAGLASVYLLAGYAAGLVGLRNENRDPRYREDRRGAPRRAAELGPGGHHRELPPRGARRGAAREARRRGHHLERRGDPRRRHRRARRQTAGHREPARRDRPPAHLRANRPLRRGRHPDLEDRA